MLQILHIWVCIGSAREIKKLADSTSYFCLIWFDLLPIASVSALTLIFRFHY